MQIGNRQIGNGAPCYVIAELGVNHNADIDFAYMMIDTAKWAGADAVKFQLYYPERTISRFCPQAEYARRAGMTDSHLEMTKRLMLRDDEYADLAAYCRGVGIEFLCTGFDETAVDTLDAMGVRAFKIPSGEINNPAYLRHVASKGKPIIMSTGMSDMKEVQRAVKAIDNYTSFGVSMALLHCVSNYPAAPEDCNLRAIYRMSEDFRFLIGFSDHTEGIAVALAAVALGACIIEKHFTLDRSLPGPDHQASCTPNEFAALVEGIRTVEKSLGDGRKRMMESERNTRDVARKSVVAARDIQEGKVLVLEDLTVKRPGTGLAPIELHSLIDRRANRDIEQDALITWDMVK